MIPRPSTLTLIQLALFFDGDADVSGARLLRSLPDELLHAFNQEPQVIPRSNLPVDIPALILGSDAPTAQITVSPARADLRRLDFKDGSTLQQALEAGARQLAMLFDAGLPTVVRLGAVCQRVAPCADAGRELAKHFCRPPLLEPGAALGRAEAFELHAHKVYVTPASVQVNSWVRNKSGFLQTDKSPVIVFEQDINIPLSEKYDRPFSKDAATGFFESLGHEFDRALALYYPEVA